MGLFEKAGRQFEQLKRQAEAAASGDGGYECTACETRLSTARDRCPECGADEVVRIEDST